MPRRAIADTAAEFIASISDASSWRKITHVSLPKADIRKLKRTRHQKIRQGGQEQRDQERGGVIGAPPRFLWHPYLAWQSKTRDLVQSCLEKHPGLTPGHSARASVVGTPHGKDGGHRHGKRCRIYDVGLAHVAVEIVRRS